MNAPPGSFFPADSPLVTPNTSLHRPLKDRAHFRTYSAACKALFDYERHDFGDVTHVVDAGLQQMRPLSRVHADNSKIQSCSRVHAGHDSDDAPSTPVILQLLRGSVSGVIAKTTVYPFDRLKMIYQVKGSVVGPFRLLSFFSQVRILAKSEGFLSLWKGNLAAVCRTFPHSGIVFFSFDYYSSRLMNLNYLPDWTCKLLAGGLAGTTSTFLTYPLDVWNTRMAISHGVFSYKQVTLLLHEGLPSLFRGFLPTLIGIFPYAGISFLSFETFKATVLWKRRGCDKFQKLTPFESMICGGTAGVISQTVTYPIDTIRKVMQANSFLYYYNQTGHIGKDHPNIRQAIKSIYANGGARAFYTGISLNWIKGFAAAGVAFCVNEQLKYIQK